MSSDSIKPLVFICYAHADEPEKPRGEEIRADDEVPRPA